MKRIAAAVQIVFILLIVGYGTFHLYRGNFEQAMATVPLLVVYYLLILAWKRKTDSHSGKHN